ncbi:rab-GTPase-TBC domain-containing protein [Cokeromyces recurvatus]|uniref:rab-GTPase-TBC domain-containing protein n=1 Tax=Cokeromyces recurvatus TaxID=90255 RepID=UPI00221F7A4B|nr:rab-GTPase-TBC domain-containing protein [Cokeromyces recurvatus]KAI7908130.1 rab-GTPase-TBC domain-containing protein [Cokeromyces recurvatus]
MTKSEFDANIIDEEKEQQTESIDFAIDHKVDRLTLTKQSSTCSSNNSSHPSFATEDNDDKSDYSKENDGSSSSQSSIDTMTGEKSNDTNVISNNQTLAMNSHHHRRRGRALTVTQNNTRPFIEQQQNLFVPDQDEKFDTIDIHDQIHELDQTIIVPDGHQKDDQEDSNNNSDSDHTSSVENMKRHKRDESYRSTMSSIHSYASSASNYDTLLARLDSCNSIKNAQLYNSPAFDNKHSSTTISSTMTMMDVDKQQEERLTSNLAHEEKEEEESNTRQEENDFDWEFWSKLILDFNNAVKSEPKMLSYHIERGGIPPSLRGMIWQLLAKSKNLDLEDKYMQLLKLESVYEKAIIRDLPKVIIAASVYDMQSDNLVNHDQQQESQQQREALFNVVKAYSLYDTEVGYSQGLLHIVSPLLLNMPEEEAFCVVVQLMNKYNLRAHFLPQSDLLSQRLYQLEGLIADHLPHIQRHLKEYGVKSSIFAYPWFSTLFSFKFPLDAVYRIYDVIFTEGIMSLFRFALALLEKNQSTILSLEFEDLTNFLKNGLLEIYHGDMNQLVKDAFQICFTTKRLDRLAKEFHVQTAKANSGAEVIETLKQQNKSLTESIQKLDQDYKNLNKEHTEVAAELISAKMDIVRIHDENETLKQQANDLKRTLETLPAEVEARVKEEMEILYTKNVALVERNSALEDQLAYMENMIIEITEKYSESEKEREGLRQRLIDLKRLMS